MKKIKYILFALLLLSSCDEPELRYFTRINNDGSVYKRVTAVGDSAKVHRNPFSFDVSDGWDVSYSKEINESDTVFFAIAEKTFPSVDASFNVFYSQIDSGQRENIKIDYHKKYRWFYTFHEYSETFLQRFPYRHFDISEFLSEDERTYFLEDDTTVINHLSGKEKDNWIENGELHLWEFISKSMCREYIRLVDSAAVLNGFDVINKDQTKFLDEIFYHVLDDGPELNELTVITDSLLNIDRMDRLYKKGYFDQFEEEVNDRMLLLHSRSYKIEFELPGLVYDTNAAELDNENLKWEMGAGEFQYCDKTVFGYYRTTNWWAFIVTFAVVVIVLWQAFIRKK
ncbi:hypothetical protein [Carboxylicivirga linearis]|uniref:Uncharacterized protein n=1 Tax=Carboxylicivirga linearis TaxID=1628157 RepID=A0ABS5JT91_9BACT|nr:hypothetical protein [Carboxylicivirga linearis]MBS2098133.1 hypothetical protein [Carboxylicivirga linearis]